jgi:hypothetical protein
MEKLLPLHNDLLLSFEENKKEYSGSISIIVKVIKKCNKFDINSTKNLNINKNCKVVQNKKSFNFILKNMENIDKKVSKNDLIEFISEDELDIGKAEIVISFKGQIQKTNSIFSSENG